MLHECQINRLCFSRGFSKAVKNFLDNLLPHHQKSQFISWGRIEKVCQLGPLFALILSILVLTGNFSLLLY